MKRGATPTACHASWGRNVWRRHVIDSLVGTMLPRRARPSQNNDLRPFFCPLRVAHASINDSSKKGVCS